MKRGDKSRKVVSPTPSGDDDRELWSSFLHLDSRQWANWPPDSRDVAKGPIVFSGRLDIARWQLSSAMIRPVLVAPSALPMEALSGYSYFGYGRHA